MAPVVTITYVLLVAINNIISEESSIDVEISGKIQKMYYRYFSDFVENKTYIPKINKNGNIMYCEISTSTLYSKDEMFALAGLLLLLEENNIDQILILMS